MDGGREGWQHKYITWVQSAPRHNHNNRRRHVFCCEVEGWRERKGRKGKKEWKRNEISQPLIGNGLVGGAPRIETIENKERKEEAIKP